MKMTYNTKIGTLALEIIVDRGEIGVWQRKFMVHLFVLWLSIRGRYNFLNLSRYSSYGEFTMRKHFAKGFDFLGFNMDLADRVMGGHRIVAFDPSYISKSGKHTPGVGYYWSGCSGSERWGLEICGIAVVDLAGKFALHLEAVQTVREGDEGLLEYYSRLLSGRRECLLSQSKYLVADAFFSRNPFIDNMVDNGFEVVGRLRKDVCLRYLYQGKRKPGRGRPKKYDGRVDPKNLREDVFVRCAKADDGSWVAYEALVNVKRWKRDVKVVVVHYLDGQGRIKGYKINFCTDVQVTGGELIQMYEYRYQQEFLFRDAKQELGLEHCQARCEKKIHFHVNTAMTALSLAKVAHHIKPGNNEEKAFSIADIRTQYINEYQVRIIFSTCGFNLKTPKIRKLWDVLTNFGKRTA